MDGTHTMQRGWQVWRFVGMIRGQGSIAGTRVARYSRIAFGDGVCHVEISAGYGQNAASDLWYLCAFMPVRRAIYGKTGSTQKIFVGDVLRHAVFWDSGRSICAFSTARCAAPGICICILYGWRDARRYDGIKCFLFPENCAIVWDDKRVFAISGNYPICFCGQRVET